MTIIDQTLSALPKDSLLTQFATLYLNAIAPRWIKDYDAKSLSDFVQERFSFFKTALAKGRDFRVVPLPGDNPFEKRFVFEFVCPDAMFLLATFEELFAENNLKILRRLHPIMGVVEDKKGVSAIEAPQEGGRLVSVTYIEFEGLEDEAHLDALVARIGIHLNAIQKAFQDKPAILKQIEVLKQQISANKTLKLAEPKEEWENLLDWLKDYNFSFYGYGAFSHTGKSVGFDAKSGLGILAKDYLKTDPFELEKNLLAHTQKAHVPTSPFVFDTIQVKSPIQRFENLMRLSLTVTEGKTTVTHVFLGLLKRTSLLVKNIETPLIHLKMAAIFKAKQMLPGSYDYNSVIKLFTTIPKFESFRTSASELLEMVEDLLSITNPNEVYCFTRTHQSGMFPLMVVIPNSLFTVETIQKIKTFLLETIPHKSVEMIEMNGEEQGRLQFYFELSGDASTLAIDHIENEVRERVKPWDEKLRDVLYQAYPGTVGKQLYAFYVQAFPDHHRVRRTPQETLRDIHFLEKLANENRVQFNLLPFHQPHSYLHGKVSTLSIYSREKIDLITIMPILQNLGLYVFDEITTRIGATDNTIAYIHSFRVTDQNKEKLDETVLKSLIVDLLTEIFRNRTSNDPLNALAISAQLNWRAINVLQLYRNLYVQLRSPYTRDRINATILKYPNASALLFSYFEHKFSTMAHFGAQKERLEKGLPRVKQAFLDSLHAVSDVTDDLILQRLFNLIDHTLRTNFYIPKTNGDTFISIKLDSQQLKQMPAPAPFREMFVYDVGFEGTHLRFGKVARGGLRWSDRLDDFRTEILGLVKTQQTKNVVIVPVGSKGGFVLKKSPLTREEAGAESEKQYRNFIRALLDITDSVNGKGDVVHPSHVLMYDEADPYLVVAADKGTANFSDLANDIAQDYGFWLGDAFASGGSIGYNHKKVGITARGAWECVTLHFSELGKDIAKESITVAGIGDMSGDVFGNGMLLSNKLKLQAAFNHAHIFLDPDPDMKKSFDERYRLFHLPRSSWTDYNEKLISKGGGIFDRKAKEIRLSEEVKRLLEVKEDVLTGEDVIKAILKMKVELLWFGGIGTYIKATAQTNTEVGDMANDAVRIDAKECRALVIGEGANLGLTQSARIEFSRLGGKLNTDAIDNSAGVNMSDYEVNIKILLQRMLEEKQLKSMDDRNAFLEAATDEVTELVLLNNQGQHRLLSMDALRSVKQFSAFAKLIQSLIASGQLNAKTETIPDATELEQFHLLKQPIPRPILAVIQAYVKMAVFNELSVSTVVQDPELNGVYESYFPKTFLKKFGTHMSKHRLRNEIIATALTNKIVNQAGITFYFQAQQLTGCSYAEITRAYLVVDAALNGEALRKSLLNSEVHDADLYAAWVDYETVLALLVMEMLQMRKFELNFNQIKKLSSVFSHLHKEVSKKEGSAVKSWKKMGFDEGLSKTLACLSQLPTAVDVVTLVEEDGLSIEQALKLVLQLDDLFDFDWLEAKLHQVHPQNQWDVAQREALRQQLRNAKLGLAGYLKDTMGKKTLLAATVKEIHHAFKTSNPEALKRYLDTLQELKSGAVDLTALSVAISRIQF
ncbi:MAG: NAD-glutamate dehydrogenase domain-containing protein [Candidatus Margulisiibacteriota bacterium]